MRQVLQQLEGALEILIVVDLDDHRRAVAGRAQGADAVLIKGVSDVIHQNIVALLDHRIQIDLQQHVGAALQIQS